jgi:hypothetical protein
MISSPSPAQQPPERDAQSPEKRIKMTPVRRRPGQSPAARFVKTIFRPIFKGIYYLLRAIRSHKIATLAIVLLLLISVFLTSFVSTGQFPFGIGNDQFNFRVHGTNGGGDLVKNWLYALRDGDSTTLSLLQKDISQPPDPATLISTYGQQKAHVNWKAINVIGVYSEADTTVDSFVEVELSASGPGGTTTGEAIFHFVTVSSNGERLIAVDVLPLRPSLA